ncbi:MAG TPA: thioredoxin domain-containing protein [bacterium]|nr:thioredoxin domain-containing protein [bacterium]
MPNRLIHETSPYLLQHAHNPVDWHPWNGEALARAQNEDKPIFLSIGYSACHWCHVMERESFEDEETARLMNEHFINIKVDREERPDLDEIYMAAVQALSGMGGWPMSVFLTPGLKPFYGGTYFPPRDMYGRPGFQTVLRSVARAYREQRALIDESAGQLTAHVRDMVAVPRGHGTVKYEVIETCVQDLRQRFDSRHGGFGQAPKFPHAMDIALLLRYHAKTRDTEALRMAEFTLEKMARGGMYDQLGGGFHRYATDAQWLIPHFEKMLYDNALLAKTYTEAYQLTRKPLYRRIVTETLDYVLREMTLPEGGFYSSQDADSEGREGIFFCWTPRQIAAVLGEEKAKIAGRYYGVDESGNFEQGLSVLHVSLDEEALAQRYGIPEDEVRDLLQEARRRLFDEREKRIKPGRDEKILTDWNGLMISALALAGNALDEPRYIQAAARACDFLLSHLKNEDRLWHTCKNGRAHTSGFLSDYAFFINGLLDTYEATRTVRWLHEALRLADAMIGHFWDTQDGAFFFTAHDHEPLIARTKNPMDNAVPSGNSLAILALLRLSEMTGNTDFKHKAVESLQAFADGLCRVPAAFCQMLAALDFWLAPPREIVLAGPDSNSLDPMQKALFERFLPNKVVLYAEPDTREPLAALSPLIEGKIPVNHSPTAYVCANYACQQPVATVDDLMARLD